jgi:hypothetical protein
VSTDSRTLRAGELFVALRGERTFDGHDFAAGGRERGAVAGAGRAPSALPVPQLRRRRTRWRRWAAAAAAWRAGFDMPVMGVAGSNGKTSTKEMMAPSSPRRGPVLATRGNLNNHIGVPLTLFGIGPEHRAAVIELGANHAGEVAALAALAADGRPRHQRGRRAPRGLRQPRGRGARRGRAVRRPAGGRHRRHQRDDALRPCGADSPAAGAHRVRPSATRNVPRPQAPVARRGRRLLDALPISTRRMARRIRLALPGLHNVRERAGRGRGGAGLPAGRSTRSSPGLARVRPSRAA